MKPIDHRAWFLVLPVVLCVAFSAILPLMTIVNYSVPVSYTHLDVYKRQVFDAVLPLLNPRARVPVCGLISAYNATSLPDGPDRLPLLMRTCLLYTSRCV